VLPRTRLASKASGFAGSLASRNMVGRAGIAPAVSCAQGRWVRLPPHVRWLLPLFFNVVRISIDP